MITFFTIFESLSHLDMYYHQTDKKSAKMIQKNGFNTKEVWTAPDTEGNYGEVSVEVYSPKFKNPFFLDVHNLIYFLENNKIEYQYDDLVNKVEDNWKFYRSLGEENPQTFNKLRKLGYDVIIDGGDRCFLYPKELTIGNIIYD